MFVESVLLVVLSTWRVFTVSGVTGTVPVAVLFTMAVVSVAGTASTFVSFLQFITANPGIEVNTTTFIILEFCGVSSKVANIMLTFYDCNHKLYLIDKPSIRSLKDLFLYLQILYC